MSETEEPSQPGGPVYFSTPAAGYDARRKRKSVWYAEQKIVEDFVARATSGQTILDVPFGTGRFADIYLARGLVVDGADISADMLATARKSLGERACLCRLRLADALHLPYEAKSFDYLVCNRFIKWLPTLAHIDRALGEFARVCRGTMLVQYTAREPRRGLAGLVERTSSLIGRPADPRSRMGSTRYRNSEILKLPQKHGLRIVDNFRLADTRRIHYLVLEAPRETSSR